MGDLDDVHSTLEGVDYKLGDVDSKLGDVHSKLEDIQSTLDKILGVLKDKSTGWEWLFMICFVFAVESWSGSRLDRFTDRCWYSARYETDWTNVHIERRPSDCDFIHAPIGSKRCLYKKSTNIFADDERK